MLIVTVSRSDYIMPFSIHICDKIIEEENELILYMETTMTTIKDYSYYSIIETENELDEEILVNLFKDFDKKIKEL
jgi:hypothetical protein